MRFSTSPESNSYHDHANNIEADLVYRNCYGSDLHDIRNDPCLHCALVRRHLGKRELQVEGEELLLVVIGITVNHSGFRGI